MTTTMQHTLGFEFDVVPAAAPHAPPAVSTWRADTPWYTQVPPPPDFGSVTTDHLLDHEVLSRAAVTDCMRAIIQARAAHVALVPGPKPAGFCERTCAAAVQRGYEAKAEIMRCTMRLIRTAVAKYAPKHTDKNKEDIFYAVIAEVWKKIEDFDPDRGNTISTFLSHWIERDTKRLALQYDPLGIRLPPHVGERAAKVVALYHKTNSRWDHATRCHAVSLMLSRPKVNAPQQTIAFILWWFEQDAAAPQRAATVAREMLAYLLPSPQLPVVPVHVVHPDTATHLLIMRMVGAYVLPIVSPIPEVLHELALGKAIALIVQTYTEVSPHRAFAARCAETAHRLRTQAACKITPTTVSAALQVYGCEPVLLSTPVHEDGGTTLADVLANPEPERRPLGDVKTTVLLALGGLSVLDRRIVCLRHGIGESRPYRMHEIACVLRRQLVEYLHNSALVTMLEPRDPRREPSDTDLVLLVDARLAYAHQQMRQDPNIVTMFAHRIRTAD